MSCTFTHANDSHPSKKEPTKSASDLHPWNKNNSALGGESYVAEIWGNKGRETLYVSVWGCLWLSLFTKFFKIFKSDVKTTFIIPDRIRKLKILHR